eukprot:TRINITY_DN2327_c0_g1_i2.p1 TRINITY_DN2327_c0_g1~~TRINITY_DN2327_c0_g1_i2.p1  ORF type:complete len:222 (+),score=69.30 TRINITY_DN2327_c0_g1_i2:311-976(+)
MRAKLDNSSSPGMPAEPEPTQNSSQDQDQASSPEHSSSFQSVPSLEEEASSTAEEWSTRQAESGKQHLDSQPGADGAVDAALDLGDDADSGEAAQTEEVLGCTAEDPSALESVFNFTKTLLFENNNDSETMVKRIYKCSKALVREGHDDDASTLERLWEEALGQASEDGSGDMTRIGKEAKSLAGRLRGMDLCEVADEVEVIFSDSFLKDKDKKDGDCVVC